MPNEMTTLIRVLALLNPTIRLGSSAAKFPAAVVRIWKTCLEAIERTARGRCNFSEFGNARTRVGASEVCRIGADSEPLGCTLRTRPPWSRLRNHSRLQPKGSHCHRSESAATEVPFTDARKQLDIRLACHQVVRTVGFRTGNRRDRPGCQADGSLRVDNAAATTALSKASHHPLCTL